MAIVKVNGARIAGEPVEWRVEPLIGMALLCGTPAITDPCGVALCAVAGALITTGTFTIYCKWTDPNDPNHTHEGSINVTLTSIDCPTSTPDVDQDCVNAIKPTRCDIVVKYLPDATRRLKRMGTELDNAITNWNNATNQIKFRRSDNSILPVITVQDICDANDSNAALTSCPESGSGSSVKAKIRLNVWWLAGNCDDHLAGWCDYDLPRDNGSIQSTITHELGHALGLCHPNTLIGNLMFPDIRRWFECEVVTPVTIEVQTVNQKYPGNP
jgi:hypothetical protein